MTNHRSFQFLAAVPFLLLIAALGAQTPPPDGQPLRHLDGTTHWYLPVAAPNGITWAEAHAAAHKAGGYLATITDAGENLLIHLILKDAKFWDLANGRGPWIGGMQTASAAEPAGGWVWVNWDGNGFQNWAKGEPDNNNNADRIQFGGTPNQFVDTWLDSPASDKAPGYVIEFSLGTVPRTIGLLTDSEVRQPGYTLLAPLRGKDIYLLDERGRPVNKWTSQHRPGVSAYLLPDGDLIRAGNVINPKFQPPGGAGGVIERFDWQGNLLWQFHLSDSTQVLHHDFEILPNGNILAIVWAVKSKADCIAAGRDPNRLAEGELWRDKIIEIQPDADGGTIVWEWDPWDHLIQDFDSTKANYGSVAANPGMIDINYVLQDVADWMHSNAIHYNAALDQVVLSLRSFDEFWIIDHSTTTAQAKTGTGGRSGKGGRLLYRWGNPLAYRAGTVNDRRLFRQHDAQWIAKGLPGAGNILVFNNGTGRPGGDASSVDEIVLPTPDSRGNYPMSNGVWGPAQPSWTYMAPTPTDLYSAFVSGAQRLPNGNTLICAGMLGRVFEVTSTGALVWEYENPLYADTPAFQGDAMSVNEMFRAPRYPPSYPAFKGRTLTPGSGLEIPSVGLRIEGSGADHYCAPGTDLDLDVSASVDKTGAQRWYQVVTSATAGTFPIDNRVIHLAGDVLFLYTVATPNSTTFQGYLGRLDSNGRARATLRIPAVAGLAGLTLHSGFVVYEPTAPTNVGLISSVARVHIR